jgi:type IV pilus assembly protein PilC
MVKAALPIVQAIESLALQQKNPAFKAVLTGVVEDLKKGQPLSQAFGRYPEAFDRVFVSFLTAGEVSGKVPAMLPRIAAYVSFQIENRQKLRTALTYPAIILAASLTVILFVVLFVLPIFVDIFNQFEAPLPLPTRILLKASTLIRTYWYVFPLLAAAAGALVWGYKDDARARERLDVFMLEIPRFGTMIESIALARILRTLALLVESGVPILKALELTRAAAENVYYDKLLVRVTERVSEGKGIASALYGNRHFPRSVAHMIATAERTGSLPEVLRITADHYQHELDSEIQNTFSALEPLFVGFLSLVVAGIAICVLQPIMSLGTIAH